MTPGRMACALAVFSVLCVLSIFLFPAMKGPYPAVHGPVTALLSMRAAARLRLGIVLAGLSAICTRLCSTRANSLLIWRANIEGCRLEWGTVSPLASGSTLRC
jgi:hypothetical protein